MYRGNTLGTSGFGSNGILGCFAYVCVGKLHSLNKDAFFFF